jgi:L-lactate permease
LKAECIFWFNFFKPYLLLVIVLFIARHAIGYANVELIYGLRQVAIYQPGALIVLFSLVWIFFQRKQNLDVSVFTQILSSSFQKSRWTLFTILLLVFLSGMLRKPVSELILSLGLSESLIFLVSPFAGVLGSFTTGSLTMSNLLLHQAFESVLSQPDNLLQVIVLLHIGGALGNAISLQNIVMVNAVLPERAPLKKVIGWNVMSVSVFVVLLLFTYLLFGS